MNTEERICKHCGCVIEGDDFRWVDDEEICQNCIDVEYELCEHCNEYQLKEKFYGVRAGWRKIRMICESCLENNSRYFFCEHCEEWHDSNYYNEIETANGETICSDCYEDDYVTCAECGDVIEAEDAYYDEGEEEYYCDRCSERRRNIRSYGYKPRPVFKTKHDTFYISSNVKELMMGVELEIDYGNNPYDTASEICEMSEDVYVKHDGSLSSDGLEIVTHPCSLEYHMENLGWDNICEKAKKNGYESHDAKTCGLHVHVGREQLGATDEERNETVAKIVLLVDRFWPQLKNFSRRKPSQLENWANAPCLNLESNKFTKEQAIEKALKCRSRGRYMAVNLTNYDTIEFRLFNGTLKESTIKATLQLVWNICKMAKDCSVEEILRKQWGNVQHIAYHNELERYVKERGIDNVDEPPVIKLADEPVVRFKIGDIVRVIGNRGYNQEGIRHGLGEVGRIIGIRADENMVEVHFARTFSDYLWRNNNGVYPVYCVNEDNLETVFAN